MTRKTILLLAVTSSWLLSCNASKNQDMQEANYTTATISVKNETTAPADTSLKKEIKEERSELKEKFKQLKEKAKKSGNNAEKEIDEFISKAEREANEFEAKNYDDKLKSDWKQFKKKVDMKIDSLDRKF